MEISEARLLRRMTQEEVAERCNMCLSTYINIERRRTIPTVLHALEIAHVLMVDPRDIFRPEMYLGMDKRKKGA